MEKSSTVFLDLKYENRNRIFNAIRKSDGVSSSELSYQLKLSRPTVKQNLDELMEEGYIYPSGFQKNTGGRRAQTYSVSRQCKVAVGLDITRNHIRTVVLDVFGDAICYKSVRQAFIKEETYWQKLGEIVTETLQEQKIPETSVLGVGISVPGLVTEDHSKVFYGKILDFTGMNIQTAGEYIPYPCRMYNDADAAGYAEVSKAHGLTDAFYISLGNNVGGAVLINKKVYKGRHSQSGEVGHMTIVPNGKKCYCGKKGCLESYCNAERLSDIGGSLEEFFEKLRAGDKVCATEWKIYLNHLTAAVNNVKMLFDCDVILGGYVGAFLDDYLGEIKALLKEKNPFEDGADYVRVCQVKKHALAIGSALPWIHELWRTI